MAHVDEKALRAELDALGLQEAEIRVAKGVYASTRRRLVEQWVVEQKRALDAAHEAEQTSIATRATAAAERSATAAERAASTAQEALAIATKAHRTAVFVAIATAIGVAASILIAFLRPS